MALDMVKHLKSCYLETYSSNCCICNYKNEKILLVMLKPFVLSYSWSLGSGCRHWCDVITTPPLRNRKMAISQSETILKFSSISHNISLEELHAELCYAECLLQKALLNFIEVCTDYFPACNSRNISLVSNCVYSK